MSFIAQRLQQIKPSATLSLNQKAAELRSAGKDILNLGAGEPDFPTPPWICDAAYEASKAGKTRYTPSAGVLPLKEAVVEKFKRENDLTYGVDEVMISTGGKQVIFNALMATVNPGDEVIIPAPYWVSYPDITRIAEGVPVIVPCSLETGFKLSPKDLEAHITPRTKWLILNSPSNPTGAAYTREELETLGAILEKHPNVWVLADDIYEHIMFDQKFYTLAQIVPSLQSRVLTLNGVSKAYSMTGWRIGYAGAPAELIKAMTKLQSQSTSNACSIAQAAALAALTGPQDFLIERTGVFKRRRDFIVEALNGIEGIECTNPSGAFYVYPSWAALKGRKTQKGQILKEDRDFATYLLEDHGIAVVPGSAFGLEGYFRISYATDDKTLETACLRLREAVSFLQ